MTCKKALLFLAISTIVLLTACSSASTTEKIYDHLEKAVTLEEAFEEQQDSIVDLEKQEQELYSKIIDLGMDDFDKIKELSQQAIEVIEKRSDKIEIEKESIEASKEEFIEVKDLIAEIEDEKVKEKAKTMYDVMINRYEAYEKLNKAYNDSLKLEKELYSMLQQKDIEQEKLTEHITKINNSYQKVLEANKKFNTFTTEYNALKKDFYKAAKIKVEYEEEEVEDKEK